MDRAQRRVFVALSVTTAVTLITEGVVNVNLMPYAAGLQVPATGLGLVFAAHRFARLLVAPWAGLAADRVGRRPLLLLGFGCVSAALMVLTVAGGFLSLLAARVFYGVASALIVTAGFASVLDMAGERERGGALGMYQAALYGVYPFGSVVGGFLTDGLGYARTFALCAGVVLANAVLALFMLRETRPPGTVAGPREPVVRLRDYPRLVVGPVRRYIALKMLSGFAIWGVFEATFVLFLLAILGQATTLFAMPLGTRSVAGVMLGTLLVLGFLLGSPVVGRWSDRSRRRMPLVLGSLALTAAALIGLSVAASAETILLAVVAVGLAVALASAPLAALVGEAAPPESRAAVMAANSTLSDLANSAGAILGASLALRVGYGVTYLGTAIAVVIGGSLLLSPRRSRGRALDEAETGAPA